MSGGLAIMHRPTRPHEGSVKRAKGEGSPGAVMLDKGRLSHRGRGEGRHLVAGARRTPRQPRLVALVVALALLLAACGEPALASSNAATPGRSPVPTSAAAGSPT